MFVLGSCYRQSVHLEEYFQKVHACVFGADLWPWMCSLRVLTCMRPFPAKPIVKVPRVALPRILGFLFSSIHIFFVKNKTNKQKKPP